MLHAIGPVTLVVWFDFVIIAIILASALVSILRGFVREALSLSAWILSLLGALRFGPSFSPLFGGAIENDTLVAVLSFVSAFSVFLVLCSILNMFLTRVFRFSGLGGADRTLGAMFGTIRGALVVAVIVMFAEWTAVPQSQWWRHSTLVPYFELVSMQLRKLMPSSLAKAMATHPTFSKLAE